ncbi:MAG TPA: DUF4294 domain-containing protein [Phnomibacter sp.]|nr:DUF4294 domain-containing protein [Phnomibacter sp.]
MHRWTKNLWVAFLILGASVGALGQQAVVTPPLPTIGPNDTIYVYLTLMPDGTWVPTSALPDVECVAKMPRWMREQQKKWSRLRNAVYVTYPYASTASKVINDINYRIAAAPNDKVRKQIIKSKEKELKEAFGEKIMNLSVYQGKVLMKLINRETGNNCYDILKEYKGGANARFWQTVAFIFGSNLKQPYRPQGEDAEMEGIVRDVERMYYPWKG